MVDSIYVRDGIIDLKILNNFFYLNYTRQIESL